MVLTLFCILVLGQASFNDPHPEYLQRDRIGTNIIDRPGHVGHGINTVIHADVIDLVIQRQFYNELKKQIIRNTSIVIDEFCSGFDVGYFVCHACLDESEPITERRLAPCIGYTRQQFVTICPQPQYFQASI